MSEFMDQGLEVFIEECEHLLLEMEAALDSLQENPGDEEIINSLFRSAHTIKGSAGLFNLDEIVEFTHRVENVLSSVRSNEINLSSKLLDQLMLCKDHTQSLVEQIGTEIDESTRLDGLNLLETLESIAYPERTESQPQNKPESRVSGDTDTSDISSSEDTIKTPKASQFAASTIDFSAESDIKYWLHMDNQTSIPADDISVSSEYWHISLRFDKDVLRNGMDPLSMIDYLATLGKIVEIATIIDDIPRAKEMDPESCYIGMEISFDSSAERETIIDVFQFISEDSQIWILPPNSKITEYRELIDRLKEDDDIDKIGQLLLQTKTLSERELAQALKLQSERRDANDQGTSPPIGEILVEQKAIHSETVNNALKKQTQVKETKLRESKYIRVNADHLDQLVDAVGELVIACEGTNLLAQEMENGDLSESTSMVSRLVEEIRDRTLSLRMVQIGDTFKRFNRIVREISNELGKSISLEISGGETELDKSLVEKIGDPLTHLIRNSIDHGIETKDDRIASNKPENGTLHLNAFHDSGYIVIQVKDDGKGIDAERLVTKAIENELIDESSNLTDQQKLQLIMHPGLSTKEEVSNLSGRGVGMDVVKQNVESMRGSIEIDSQVGTGTVISMRMPLTLSIISGLLVGVGAHRYVLPLDSVIECVELPKSKLSSQKEGDYINLRNKALPYIDLSKKFGEQHTIQERKNIVVVKHGDSHAGLVVDQLLGEYQTVIKPLNKIFSGLSGISGSTILGDGEVSLILDIPALIAQARNLKAIA